VDAVKDPYIIELNVNPTTYDILNYLLRTGAGEFAFDFITQPVMFDLADFDLEKDNKIIASESKSYYKTFDLYLSKAFPTENVVKLKELIKSGEIVIPSVTKNNIEKDQILYENRDKDFYLRQLGVLLEYKRINTLSEQLLNLVQLSQIDTKKFGKNIVEVRSFLNAIDSLNLDMYQNADKLFNVNLEDHLFTASYLEDGVKFINELVSDISIYATTLFEDMMNTILGLINKTGSRDSALLNNISEELFTSIISDFFKDEIKATSTNIKKLILGTDSIVNKISEIKSGKYPELSENMLISHLVPVFVEDSPVTSYFKISASRISDKWDIDNVIRDWETLLSHSDETIRALGKKLFVYSFFTSGFRNRIFSFNNFIPTELVKSIDIKEGVNSQSKSLDGFIKEKLIQFKTGNISGEKVRDIIHEVFVNNWYNADLVKDITTDKKINVIVLAKDKTGTRNILKVEDKSKYTSIGDFVKFGSDLFERIGSEIDGEKLEYLYLRIPKKGFNEKGIVLVEYGLEKSILDENNNGLFFSKETAYDYLDKKGNVYSKYNILEDKLDNEEIILEEPNSELEFEDDNVPTLSQVEVKEDIKQASDYESLSTIDKPLIIYVDGSDANKQSKENILGYGSSLSYSGDDYVISGSVSEIEAFRARFPGVAVSNPTMELLGLVEALNALKETNEHIVIRQDYSGAINFGGLWDHSSTSEYQRADKPWVAKEEYIKYLVNEAEKHIEQIEKNGGSVRIQWVPGHVDSSKLIKFPNVFNKYGKDEVISGNNKADTQAKRTESINTFKDLIDITKYGNKTIVKEVEASNELIQQTVDKINNKFNTTHTIKSLQVLSQEELNNLLNCL
jgi:ribonuclease HI